MQAKVLKKNSRPFSLAMNNYKDKCWKIFRKESCMSQNFFKHFFREGHHDFFGDALVWMNGWMDGWMDG